MKNPIISTGRLALSALMLGGIFTSAQADDNLYVYKNGVIMFREKAANVDSVAMEKDKSVVTLYNAAKEVLYTSPRSQVDSISFTTDVPQADMLDVRFNADGTATDISPMQMEVQKIGNTQTVYYNETYKRYAANFVNPWAGSPTGYYRIDWENNTKFKNMLANGHTLECIVMGNYTPPIANSEAKWFSSHQGGGTGFLISTTNSSGRQNEITFLPNVSTTGSSTWRWATSGVVPQPGEYYHLVGVWSKALKKAYIYVNGVLKNVVDASGNFVLPQSGSGWFGIGCDPSGSNGSTAWNGDVVLARIYDTPLNSTQVSKLWNQVHILEENAPQPMVTDVSYSSGGYPVASGSTFTIEAKGFQEGDQMVIQQINSTNSITVPLENITSTGATFTIPDELTTGQYTLILQRGDQTQRLGTCTFVVSDSLPHGMKVIAHRGYWDKTGSAENSRSSLRNAFDAQCYGSETDVWITLDGHVMVNHDASYGGVNIQNSYYDDCKDLTLKNGEKMPQLQDLLDMLAEEDSCKLIIEVKTHSNETRGKICCDSCVTQVRRMGLQDKVEYIAFSLNLCREIVRLDPEAHVAYLNGDKDPQTLYNFGIMGLDYTAKSYRNNPTWVSEAHALGMTTNVWTINNKDEMIEMSNLDIDYITTNAPETAKEVYEYYRTAYQSQSKKEAKKNEEDAEE